jgi:heterotetrameric sarcosine oxidase gamma subunit
MPSLQAVSGLGTPRGSMGAVSFESPRLRVSEAPLTTVLSLRPSRNASHAGGITEQLRAYGLEAPTQPNGLSGSIELGCAWLEPRAWLVLSERPLPAAAQTILSVTDISDRVCLIKLDGVAARDLIAAGCDTSMLRPGRMARVRFAGMVNLIIECHAESAYRLAVDVSFAEPLMAWLVQAAANQA